MKKSILFSSLVVVGFISCNGSSEEGKELLQRLLTIIGIPQEIIVNICQDGNNNEICDIGEIQNKITFGNKETLDNILEKVNLTEDGKFTLENYDSTKNILMELQNIEKFKFDNGKFTFKYLPPTTELSVLQTIVDAGYLTSNDTIKAKEMNRVADFYAILLEAIYTNLNILRSTNIDNRRATNITIKESGDELLGIDIANGFPDKMNECGDNKACTDRLLDDLYIKLVIDDVELQEIVNNNGGVINNEENESVLPEGTPFITTWKTYNSGISEKNQITIPTDNNITFNNKFGKTTNSYYNYTILWGDGTRDRNVTGDITHTYEAQGTYTVEIYGIFPRIVFGKDFDGNINTIESDARKLLSIVQWGDNRWSSMEGAFSECINLEVDANDIPNLSNVISMRYMFFGAKELNQDIGNWNVSNIRDMEGLFELATKFNQDISEWDVGNVTNMNRMFRYAIAFNQDIGDWNVKNVKSMTGMFEEARTFNQKIGNWNVTSVTDMSGMFKNARLSTENYDDLLIGWHLQDVQNGVNFDAGSSQYSDDAEDARNEGLIKKHEWNINDGEKKESTTTHSEEEDSYTSGL